MERDYKVLELDKILEKAAKGCACADAADIILNTEPQSNLKLAEQMLDETAEAFNLSARFGSPSFGGLINVKELLSRAAMGSSLTAGELLKVAVTLTVIRSVYDWRATFSGVNTILDKYFRAIIPNKYLEDKIKRIIISEEEISDNASPNLSGIRRKIRLEQNRIREQLDKLIKNREFRKYLQDSVVTMRDGRFVVPVKAECRGEIAGMVHDVSASGATVFVEPAAVVDANNNLRVLETRERDEIEQILFGLSQEAGGFYDSLCQSYDNTVMLNAVFAKANYGYELKAAKPSLNDRGRIVLKSARHPLIPADRVVPINLTLGCDFDTMIITGPNTGGKTVTIKTVGLLTAMAMCGFLIPVNDGSEISVFDRVLSDIGDEQSIEQSLSTFSAHMTNIKRILAVADHSSLVLLDELGAGTDPVEGAALAEAILEKLRKQGAKIAATTHYAEIKAYAIRTKGAVNAGCEFDIETLRPTYRLEVGSVGRSNAFAISLRLGIPEDVVQRADKLISNENREFEEVVRKLEATRQELREKSEEAQRYRIQAENEMKRAKAERIKLEKERERELDRARQKATDIVETARDNANRLLNELEDIKKAASEKYSGDLLARARASMSKDMKDLEDKANPVEQRTKGDYKLPRPLKVGDSVRIIDIDKPGTVLEYREGEDSALVSAGIFKTRVSLDNLKLEKPKKQSQSVGSRRSKIMGNDMREGSMECDIRGMDGLDGCETLDSFIDNAMLTNVNRITVIHGKGTGALRKAVHAFLKGDKRVKGFRLGVYGEGAEGVTIVELK